ncbi:hypothetical protein TNCV_989921 [Trichonephila clavipes]|nr:hypothetical protein TNCV_989921 [Trichonephila clavipes]
MKGCVDLAQHEDETPDLWCESAIGNHSSLGCIFMAIKDKHRAVGSLVVRASDSRPEGLGSMPDATKHPLSTHGFTCRNCGGGDRGRVAIYRPFGEFRRAKSHCHLYGAQGQRQVYFLFMRR